MLPPHHHEHPCLLIRVMIKVIRAMIVRVMRVRVRVGVVGRVRARLRLRPRD